MAEVALVASIISAATSVVSLAMTLSMDNSPKDNGVAVERKGQDNPKVVPFGRCLVPSTRVWNNVSNQHPSVLVQAHSFGVGQIKGYEQIYIDSVPVFTEGYNVLANKWYQGDFDGSTHNFPNLNFGLRVGMASEQVPYPDLLKYGDGEWDSTCRGDRTPSMQIRVDRRINEDGDNNVRIISDRFQVEALVNGVAVIDPRFDITLAGAKNWQQRKWTNTVGNDTFQSYRNPACVVLTYLLDDYYGLGLPTDAVDINSFITLANYCDEFDFKFDGYVDQGDDYGAILTRMITSFDGLIYVEDGVVKVKADSASPVVAHIVMDDMVGNFKLSSMNDSSYYNIVNVEFINETTNFAKDKYVLPANISECETIKRDGFEKDKSFKLDYTTDSEDNKFRQVKFIANRLLKKVQNQRTIEFDLDNTKKIIKLWDVIEITQPDYKLEKAKFRVTKVVTTLDDQTMISKVTATEYNESVYDDSDYDDGITSPPIKPPKPDIPAPANLLFTQTGQNKGLVSWDTEFFGEHRFHLQYKPSTEDVWCDIIEVMQSPYEVADLEVGLYDFRVRLSTTYYGTSQYTTITEQEVQEGAGLPNVTGLTGTFTGVDAVFKWDDMKKTVIGVNEDETLAEAFSHYEVIISKGTVPELADRYLVTDNFFSYTFDEHIKGKLNRNLKAEVFVVDKNDNRSFEGAVVLVKNSQVMQPSGVKVNAVLQTVVVSFDPVSVEDYQATDLHISQSETFTPSNSTLVETSDSNSFTINKVYEGDHYLRVGHYDKFGKDEMAYSPAILFRQQSIDDVLDDSPHWENINGNIDKIEAELAEAASDIINNATKISQVNQTVGRQGALIEENRLAVESVDGRLTNVNQSLSSKINNVSSNLSNNYYTMANTDKAIAAAKTALSSEIDTDVGKLASDIENTYITRTDAESSIAASEQRLEASIEDGKSAAIEHTNQAVATVDGKVEAITQIKHTVDGKVSGLIMGNDGETSNFTVVADNFMVTDKAGDKSVFQVKYYKDNECKLGCSGKCIGHTMMKDALIGDLRVGSVNGNAIDATTRMRVGSGNQSVTLSGDNPSYVFWAGHTDPSLATVRINKAGAVGINTLNVRGGSIKLGGTLASDGMTVIDPKFEVAPSGKFKAHAGEIKGNVIVGPGTTNRKLVIRGNSPQDEDLAIIAGVKDANDLDDWTWGVNHNGRMRIRNSKRETIMDLDPARDHYYFRGTLEAENIVGDIVSAIRKSAPSVELRGTGSRQMCTVSVTNARSFDREISFSSKIALSVSISATYDTNKITGRVKVTGDFGTFYSPSYTVSVSGQGSGSYTDSKAGTYTPTVVVPIPKNAKGQMQVSFEVTEAVTNGGGSCRGVMTASDGNNQMLFSMMATSGDLA